MRLPNPGFFDQLSRRRVLRDLAALAAAAPLRAVAGSLLPAGEVASVRPVFEEVPAVEERHSLGTHGGKSAAKYLPESSGAGCAFLDFDNDGWMDIYLVNSGKANFFNPPQPLAECALSQQSRRHFHRCDGESRAWRAAAMAWASRWGTTTAMAFLTFM